ncbi:MAG: hypothetical protein ACQUHE_07345 [Bacteroidia bacterium]
MITFESEAGYNLLLADRKELLKLKKSSYLDLKFLEQNNQYRVHLYYKDRKKTRFSHWLPKYPQVKKTVEVDETDIRIKVELEKNSLSQAIDAIQIEPDSSKSVRPKDLGHEKPPSPQEHIKGKKKIKVNENRTKSQLISEISNLKADLDALRNNQVQTEKKMLVLLDEQEFYKSVLSEVIEKLSPRTKTQYEHIFDNTEKQKKGNNGKNHDYTDDFYLESPKSRVPTEKGKGPDYLENSAQSSERIEEMDIFPHEENISEKQEEDNASSSLIHFSADEAKFIEKSPIHKSPTEHVEKLQTIETLPAKKTTNNKRKLQTVRKMAWSNFREDVLKIWRGIKAAMQRGESEDQIRQNKNTSTNWKTVLDPNYKYREIFQAFLNHNG